MRYIWQYKIIFQRLWKRTPLVMMITKRILKTVSQTCQHCKVTNLEILVKNVKKPEDFSGPLLPQQYIKRTLLIRLFHSNWHRNKAGTDIYSDIISFFKELKYFGKKRQWLYREELKVGQIFRTRRKPSTFKKINWNRIQWKQF